MTKVGKGIILAAVVVSHGLLAAAKEEVRQNDDNSRGVVMEVRRKRALKKTHNNMATNNDKRRTKKNGDADVMDEEDVAFWTRLLQGERGKETDFFSLPIIPRPPTPDVRPPLPTPFPTYAASVPVTPFPVTPFPTDGGGGSIPVTADPTRRPTRRPTANPTNDPTRRPSNNPTRRPTPIVVPTPPPTPNPTRRPTPNPTLKPTPVPTENPISDTPTYEPTLGTSAPVSPAPTSQCAGLTAAERQAQIIQQLSSVSSPDLFEVNGSPQRKALRWILQDDSETCPDDENLVQRYTLAVFYYSTNGDAWKKCSAPDEFDGTSVEQANDACTLTTVNATTIFPNDIRGTNAWLTPDSECLWGGISCYSANAPNSYEVNVVEFENNGLTGTLPSEMEKLANMRFFALERGQIGGTIPEEYGNLKPLLLMDFDFNRLTGELPEGLWELTNLRQLDLNDNELEGTLSEDIGKLKQLRFFQIDNNQMEGDIPGALGSIPNFSLIGLSGNDFDGAMPDEVCELRPSPLQTLVVDCDIECEIPACCTSCVPVRR